MADILAPDIDDLNRPYWDALKQGRLTFQHCDTCGNNWLPAREACPNCLGRKITWTEAKGGGRVLSWVVYHTAYHESFKGKTPYNVTLVELDEGPRMLTNVVNDAKPTPLSIGARVQVSVEHEGEVDFARFRLIGA